MRVIHDAVPVEVRRHRVLADQADRIDKRNLNLMPVDVVERAREVLAQPLGARRVQHGIHVIRARAEEAENQVVFLLVRLPIRVDVRIGRERLDPRTENVHRERNVRQRERVAQAIAHFRVHGAAQKEQRRHGILDGPQ